MNLFITNKYTTWYYNIIDRAQIRNLPYKTLCTERHHIIPQCVGGDQSLKNLVVLYYKEHFICHWLLTKMIIIKHRRKLNYAFGKFVQGRKNILSSSEYARARKAIIEARSGTTHTAETKKKMSDARLGVEPWNKGMKNPYSEETLIKMSESHKGNTFIHTQETKEMIRKSNLGLKRTQETKDNISNSKKGKKNYWYGKNLSENHKKNLSKAMKHQNKYKCTYCNKLFNGGNYKRWHDDNCKHK